MSGGYAPLSSAIPDPGHAIANAFPYGEAGEQRQFHHAGTPTAAILWRARPAWRRSPN